MNCVCSLLSLGAPKGWISETCLVFAPHSYSTVPRKGSYVGCSTLIVRMGLGDVAVMKGLKSSGN